MNYGFTDEEVRKFHRRLWDWIKRGGVRPAESRSEQRYGVCPIFFYCALFWLLPFILITSNWAFEPVPSRAELTKVRASIFDLRRTYRDPELPVQIYIKLGVMEPPKVDRSDWTGDGIILVDEHGRRHNVWVSSRRLSNAMKPYLDGVCDYELHEISQTDPDTIAGLNCHGEVLRDAIAYLDDRLNERLLGLWILPVFVLIFILFFRALKVRGLAVGFPESASGSWFRLHMPSLAKYCNEPIAGPGMPDTVEKS